MYYAILSYLLLAIPGLLYNLYVFRYIWKDLTIRSTNKLTICMVLKNCYT